MLRIHIGGYNWAGKKFIIWQHCFAAIVKTLALPSLLFAYING